MSSTYSGGVDTYAAFFIAYKARTLIRMPIFRSDDYEDLQQELMLAYLLAWPNYEPEKGDKRSFIKAVVNTKALMLVRDAERQKRWTGLREVSLSKPIGEEDSGATLADIIDEQSGLWGSVFSEESASTVEQRLDIHRMLSIMPEDLKQTFRILTENSVSEAALILGIPRTTMSSRLKKLKKFVEDFMVQK